MTLASSSGAPSSASPAPVPVAGPSPLGPPPYQTPLIGREREAAAVQAFLLDGPRRLVTLTGPGGVGKTRLAHRVAAALTDHLAGGVAFVSLDDVADHTSLLPAISRALGIDRIGPERVERLLAEAAEGFDLALEVGRTAGPFQHKLQRHLRPYFVDSCRSMLDEGYHREALGWVLPYHLATADVILADGPEADRSRFAARQGAFLKDLGLETAQARAARFEEAKRLYDRIFALATEIVASHPGVVD